MKHLMRIWSYTNSHRVHHVANIHHYRQKAHWCRFSPFNIRSIRTPQGVSVHPSVNGGGGFTPNNETPSWWVQPVNYTLQVIILLSPFVCIFFYIDTEWGGPLSTHCLLCEWTRLRPHIFNMDKKKLPSWWHSNAHGSVVNDYYAESQWRKDSEGKKKTATTTEGGEKRKHPDCFYCTLKSISLTSQMLFPLNLWVVISNGDHPPPPHYQKPS